MGKIQKEEEWRRQGMAYAYKVAVEKGIEGLARELKWRNATKAPLALKEKDVIEYSIQVKREMCIKMQTLLGMALRDTMGFGAQRVEKVINNFEQKCEDILEGYTTWSDWEEVAKDELGLDLKVKAGEQS